MLISRRYHKRTLRRTWKDSSSRSSSLAWKDLFPFNEGKSDFVRHFSNVVKDSQFATQLLYECAVGIKCFAGFFLDLVVTSFVSSFEEHVVPLSTEYEDDKKDEILAKLITWNSSYFPPKMIEEGVFNKIKTIGVNYLSKEKAEHLLRISHLISRIKTEPNRLSKVMESIVLLLQNKN